MSKSKFTPERKIAIVKKYLSGTGSYDQIAKAHRISKPTLRGWVWRFQEQGEEAFYCGSGSQHYSKAFKIKCVEAVLCGEGSVNEIVAKYNISDRSVLRNWIKCYNANMELK